MDHTGHRERLRARYGKEGLAGFLPHEALELLLTYAIPRVDTKPLAHALMTKFHSLSGVLEASTEELQQVEGIGPRSAAMISMLLPLFRMYQQEKALPRPKLCVYDDLAAYCRTLFLGVGVEEFYVLCLDARVSLLAAVKIARGTPSQVSVLPRLVLQELLRHNAAGAVICHNHPGGCPKPSQQDVDITLEIQRILASLGIRLYDHIIISGCQDYSFNAHHLLDGGTDEAWASSQPEALPMAAERAIGAVNVPGEKKTCAKSRKGQEK